MTDPGQPPSSDQTLGDQPLEKRTHLVDEGLVQGHPAGGIGPARDVVRVRDDIRMQKEQIEPRQPQTLETCFNRLPHQRFDLGGGRISEIAFASDPHALGQPAGERLAYHQLGLAVAVTRREVDPVDPGGDRRVHSRDAFVEGRLPPQHAEATPAEG